MTGADGKLSGYAYIALLLTDLGHQRGRRVRDKIAFVQDAFVRDVNSAGIAKNATRPRRYRRLDRAAAGRVRRGDGAGKIAAIGVAVRRAPSPVETPS